MISLVLQTRLLCSLFILVLNFFLFFFAYLNRSFCDETAHQTKTKHLVTFEDLCVFRDNSSSQDLTKAIIS